MKFDDLVYNILEQERKGGKLLAGAALGAAGTYAALNPEKAAEFAKSAASHIGSAASAIKGKVAHAASSPNHPTETQFKEPGPSHAPKTHHPTEPQHQEPGPSHAPSHNIDIPDHGV